MPTKVVEKKKFTDEDVSRLREDKALVYYEKSLTKNLGNYESTKITVGVTLPVCPTESELEAIRATIEVADTVLMEELETQIKELAAN